MPIVKYNLQEVLDKGEEVVRELGFESAGLSDILKECGIPRGSFYNFFKNKEDFGIQVLRNYCAKLRELYSHHLKESHSSASEKIRSLFEAIIRMNKREGFSKGCLLASMLYHLNKLPSSFKSVCEDEFKNLLDQLTQSLSQGQTSGDIQGDLPPSHFARLILNAMNGATGEMKILSNETSQQETLNTILKLIETSPLKHGSSSL